MERVKVTFVIGLREDEVEALRNDEIVVSKMILIPDDYELFRYREGDLIEAESQNGNREWCRIYQLEKVQQDDNIILIFTLEKAGSREK
jgi:hypothetical protein